jgi:hypothetical protein
MIPDPNQDEKNHGLDPGSDEESNPLGQLSQQQGKRKDVENLQLVQVNQFHAQPIWIEAFNAESVRHILATAFPHTHPSSFLVIVGHFILLWP